MRVVAIGTTNSLVIHPALDEGPVDVNLILDLAIGKVGVGSQQFQLKVVTIGISGPETGVQDASSAVTGRTSLQLGFRVVALELCQTVAVTAIPKQ